MQKILDHNSRVYLAPMAGITDAPFRRIMHSFGQGNLYSEMVMVNALERNNPKTYRIADVRTEPYPVIVQLAGGDPALFSHGAKLCSDLGAASIDINMGCPVKKIIANQAGSYLMKDIKRASDIIKSTVSATHLPVSVKFRKGWDENSVNAVEFAKMCEECGASYITIHGRTKAQMYSSTADWNIIKQVKETVKIPVIANGDITSPEVAKQALEHTNADGLMVGRGSLGRPWLVSQIHNFIENGTQAQTISINTIEETLLQHISYLQEYYGPRLTLPLSRKYVCWYCKGLPSATRFREQYVRIDNIQDALKAIHTYFSICQQQEENKQ